MIQRSIKPNDSAYQKEKKKGNQNIMNQCKRMEDICRKRDEVNRKKLISVENVYQPRLPNGLLLHQGSTGPTVAKVYTLHVYIDVHKKAGRRNK